MTTALTDGLARSAVVSLLLDPGQNYVRLFAVERSLHELLLAETDGGSFAEAWGTDRIRQASRSAEKVPERRQLSASPPGAR